MSLKETAREVLTLLDEGRYVAPSGAVVDISQAQAAAASGTRLYTPEQLAELMGSTHPAGAPPRVEVTDETTQVAARRLAAAEGDIVVLNFASARNPGGGFVNGAKAQEEDLCRCSGLYPCLLTQMTYFEENRRQRSALYTDHMIYSPAVPFFRTRGRSPYLETPFLASVITAPAPNRGAVISNTPDEAAQIPEVFARRWGQVLAIARDNGHRVVVLGAWGCGAFQNDPAVAAAAARDWLLDPHFAGTFERVVFAIPGSGERSARNLEVFGSVLE